MEISGVAMGQWLGLVAAVWVQCIFGNNYTFSRRFGFGLVPPPGGDDGDLRRGDGAVARSRRGGHQKGLGHRHRPRLRPSPHPDDPSHWVSQGPRRVRHPVASRAPIHSPLPLLADVHLLVHGREQHDLDEYGGARNVHPQFLQEPRDGVRDFEGLRGPQHDHLHQHFALFSDDPASFLFLLAVAPTEVCTTAMLFLRESSPEVVEAEDDGTDSQYFRVINAMAVVIAGYLLAFDLTGKHGTVVSRVFAAVLLLLLAVLVAVLIHISLKLICKSRICEKADVEDGGVTELLLTAEVKTMEAEDCHSLRAEEAAETGDRRGRHDSGGCEDGGLLGLVLVVSMRGGSHPEPSQNTSSRPQRLNQHCD
ncbi:hypothetical protein ZIOFF_008536 [Zingiber officinale]|uniref:Nodulin-like domain-containing protein n=1 Tax=Zingiber officinale TaxID=94328 RepID=A0A8J5HST7_ZINOF|nr:hypothetical protein ZIOFF_008536 [Zingiber officinale]